MRKWRGLYLSSRLLLIGCLLFPGKNTSAETNPHPAEPSLPIPIPIPVLLDRERIDALKLDVVPQVTVLGIDVPLVLTLGSDVIAPMHRNGAIRQAAIRLTNRGDTPVRDLLILLREVRGRIEKIYSRDLSWRQTEHGWLTAVPELGAGTDMTISVKYALSGSSTGPAGMRNELLAIVRPRGTSAIEATLSWDADDCAGRFSRRLQSIRNEPGNDPKRALQLALQREADMPKRFLFPVSSKGLERNLKSALRLAEARARSGGVEPKLRSDEYKWLTGRLSRDLRNYLGQPANPAICAPAAPMLDYLQRRAAPIDRRVETVNAERDLWRNHARKIAGDALTTLAALRLAVNDPEFHVSPRNPVLEPDWQHVIPQLAEAGGMSDQALAILRQAATPLEMLQEAKTVLAEDPGFAPTIVRKPRRPGSRRMIKIKEKNPRTETLRAAFGVIERAAYLDLAAARLDALDKAFVRSLSAIRKANEENCICAY